MNDVTPKEPVVLHTEVAVALLVAVLVLTLGLTVAVITWSWTPALLASIVACGTVFTAACIPQIRAAVERRNEQAKQ